MCDDKCKQEKSYSKQLNELAKHTQAVATSGKMKSCKLKVSQGTGESKETNNNLRMSQRQNRQNGTAKKCVTVTVLFTFVQFQTSQELFLM